jgi:hypothetical protein
MLINGPLRHEQSEEGKRIRELGDQIWMTRLEEFMGTIWNSIMVFTADIAA